MRQGPLAGRYSAAAVMVICALVPYLALSAALQPLTPIIAHRLHMSLQELSLSSGMANAGYAVGTVLAVVLAQHLPQRRMMVLYATFLVVGSILTAAAMNPGEFIAGRVLQGLCTSLLLIAAGPPLFIGYPAAKMKVSAGIFNLCIFGAVALGPTIGGIQANAHAWRPLFWAVAGVSLTALVLSVLTFEDTPPADTSAPWGPAAVGTAAVGCVAMFYGASELLTHRFLDASTFGPLIGGIAAIVVLIVYQYRARRPLLTVRGMLSSTMPVAGIVVALSAAAASVAASGLTAALLLQRYEPFHVGLLFLPEFAGAVMMGFALGVLLDKRQLHYLPLVGMIFLAAGIGLFRIELPPSQGLTLAASGLTGIGLGATVAPALFVAGFSLPAASLQRVFAIVELLRAAAAFMIAPVFAHFAATVGGNPRTGTGIALWIGLGVTIGGAVIAVLLYVLGQARAQKPDVERFLAGEGPAWYSPRLLAGLRRRASSRSTLADDPARP
jgi:MFS family permease